MTILGILLGIEVAGLAFALVLAHSLSRQDGGASPVHRLTLAMERAVRAFLIKQYGPTGLIALFALLALFALSLATPDSGPLGRTTTLAWTALGVLMGALGSAGAAYFSASMSIRGARGVVDSARISLDRALANAMRAAGVSAIATEALSVLGPAALFAAAFAVRGGFAANPELRGPIAADVSALLPSFALGAAIAGLVLQRSGSAYHAASDVGGDLAGERDAGLEHDDPRNPALVSDLVGDQLGVAAASSADTFATSTAMVAACGLLALHSGGDVVALGLVPILLRSFALVASATGVLVVRSEEAKSADSALLRGEISAICVLIFGVAAAAHIVVGENWALVLTAGCLGVLGAAAGTVLPRAALGRRGGAIKKTVEMMRVGDGAAVASGIGAGLESALLPVVCVGASAAGSMFAASHFNFEGAQELALVTWLAAISGLLPYAFAAAQFAGIADTARSMAGIASTDPDLVRRVSRLDEAGFGASSVARTFGTLVSGASIATLGAALLLFGNHGVSPAEGFSGSVTLLWCGALGAAFVLAYAGRAAKAAVRGAREVANEVERQLRGFPREQGLAIVPVDFTPSYKTCEELTSSASRRGVLLEVSLYLSLPLLLGFALRLMYRAGHPGLLASGLVSFVVVAAVTGLGTALTVDFARAILGGAKRAAGPRGASVGFAAAITGDVVADILANVVGPAARLIGKASAALLLSAAPFLF